MPRAAGCERLTKCSQIDSVYTKAKETGCKGFGDGQFNRDEEE
jgi:hypothetical protein